MHTIKIQDNETLEEKTFDKYITDVKIIKEIKHMLDHHLDYTFYDGVKIDLVSDFRKNGDRETIVSIGFP